MIRGSALEIAVTHLNVPVGEIVTVDQLTQALRTGTVAGLKRTPAAVLSYLFVELEPSLIARCAAEAGANLRTVNQLYEESLRGHLPRTPAWEEAVAQLI
jgi:hypothetical protein